MNSVKNALFRGIIVPLVTPLAEPGVPDMEQLSGLIDHVAEGQVGGIFILGTTGEGSSLDFSTRQQVIEHACRHVKRKKDAAIFVGIIDTPLSEAVTMAHIAADNGADGIVLSAPYVPMSQEALLEYTRSFLRECSLPVCLYNRPNQAEIAFSIDVLRSLLLCEKIKGIKDSSGDRNYFTELIQLKKDRPNWSVLMGFEELLAEAVREGADGGVAGGANLFPGLYVSLYNAAVKNNTSEIQHLQSIADAVVENIYQPHYLAGLKYALSCKQLCRETLAEPPYAADPEQQRKIRQFLENVNLSFG